MQLKECPFCGSEDIIIDFDSDCKDIYCYQVRCDDVECVGWHCNWFETEEEAVEAWNRRV